MDTETKSTGTIHPGAVLCVAMSGLAMLYVLSIGPFWVVKCYFPSIAPVGIIYKPLDFIATKVPIIGEIGEAYIMFWLRLFGIPI